ncbi:MAG: AAA family ATPase [Oscillospiraceae bacterium]|nr:AAA family ATPase [Oscillospiraceae bacterium]
MKLLLLFGNMAVGKMTVGQELAKITKLKLFHNHMMIEPVLEIFGDFRWSTIERLRKVIFEDFATSDNEGLIFTFMWELDQPADWVYVEHIVEIFKEQKAEIYFAELDAPEDVRLQRNITENRLRHKGLCGIPKIHVLQTNTGRYISNNGEIPFENYMRINNEIFAAGNGSAKDKREIFLVKSI